jgi:PEGA domain
VPQAPSVPPVPDQSAKAKVEILSDPAGARIEVNDNYVGDAPITVEIPQSGGYFTRNTVIRALPTEGGDYVQAKYFSGSIPDVWYPETVGAHRDQIPSRIFFDVRLGPVTPQC